MKTFRCFEQRVAIHAVVLSLTAWISGCVNVPKPVDRPDVSQAEASQPTRSPGEVIRLAKEVAQDRQIDLHDWPEPTVTFDSRAGEWWVHFTRHRYPGDHFSVAINDASGETRFHGGR